MRYEIDASEWINTARPLSLQQLRGQVVMVTAFQMLCQGCARHTLPQAAKVHETFLQRDVIVIGLHSVFEHHHVMTPDALRAFAYESRLAFPIAVDRAIDGHPLPSTMSAWALEGTPSLLIFDRDGELAARHFGHVDDLRLGAMLGELVRSPASQMQVPRGQDLSAKDRAPVCPIPHSPHHAL
jgi:hypothetical protein